MVIVSQCLTLAYKRGETCSQMLVWCMVSNAFPSRDRTEYSRSLSTAVDHSRSQDTDTVPAEHAGTSCAIL